MEKAPRRQKKGKGAAPLRGDKRAGAAVKHLAVSALDTKEQPRDKATRRRLKREAFLLKLETASANIELSKRPAVEELPVNDMRKALPLVDWDAAFQDVAGDGDSGGVDDNSDDGVKMGVRKGKKKPLSFAKAKEQALRVQEHAVFKSDPLAALEEHIGNCFATGVLPKHVRKVDMNDE